MSTTFQLIKQANPKLAATIRRIAAADDSLDSLDDPTSTHGLQQYIWAAEAVQTLEKRQGRPLADEELLKIYYSAGNGAPVDVNALSLTDDGSDYDDGDGFWLGEEEATADTFASPADSAIYLRELNHERYRYQRKTVALTEQEKGSQRVRQMAEQLAEQGGRPWSNLQSHERRHLMQRAGDQLRISWWSLDD